MHSPFFMEDFMEITFDTPIEDIVSCEEGIKVMLDHKLVFIACGEPVWATLGEILEEQNVPDKEKKEILNKLNEVCK